MGQGTADTLPWRESAQPELAMHRINAPLAILLLAATVATSTIAAGTDESADGARIVKQRCVACHDQKKLLSFAARHPSDERAARWERFLPGHYLPKAEERAAVINWLKDNAGP